MPRLQMTSAPAPLRRPFAALLVLLLLGLLGGAPGWSAQSPGARPTLLTDSQGSDLVPLDRFPAEERRAIERTLALIDAGGPFPWRQDGSPFRNREHLLPDRGPSGYREYTVPTPGAVDRGARRIVAGRDGEAYYSNDHYRSFHRIRRGKMKNPGK
jgi:ribonuclease T1